MYKRWMLLLMVSLMLFGIAGCGKNENNDTTEVGEESAVGNTTADSDDIQYVADLPAIPATDMADAVSEEASFKDGSIVCELPNGFKADPNEEGLYVHKNYPKDLSTISYVIAESGEDVTQIKQNEYQAMLEADFLSSYGDDVTVNITLYQKIKVDGRNGLKIKLNYEFKGVMYEQLIYMLYNGDESHILCFTQDEDGKWEEEFEKCGDSISFRENE